MGFTTGVGWKGETIMAKNVAERAYELGKEYEKTKRGCSQCVVAALQDVFGIRNDDIFKAATGLAGGGGGTLDGSCGSYTGAIMVLSSLLGRERDNFVNLDQTDGFKAMELVRKFREKYIQEYGSVVCRNIQTKTLGRPYYVIDPDEMKKFEEAGGHSDKGCPEVVGKAARWMAELILEEKLLPRSK
jgi:C_GCAxxG_C_C family probable redox protein